MQEEKLSYLKNLTLLLVDDDDEILNKMQTILSIFFKSVIPAEDGSEAFDIFTQQSIDMVITDYTMPKMSGYNLCKNIRAKNKDIPLVIMSNYSDKEKLLSAIPLSLAQYLIKPVSYTSLTSTLISMVEKVQDVKLKSYKIDETLSYDRTNKELKTSAEVISLSKSEVITLELFLDNKNMILSNSAIERCLDPTENMSEQAMKSLIYRLRKKVGKNIIINIPGFGYMFKTDSEV